MNQSKVAFDDKDKFEAARAQPGAAWGVVNPIRELLGARVDECAVEIVVCRFLDKPKGWHRL